MPKFELLPKLRNTHPNLFYFLLVYGIFYLLVGITFIVNPAWYDLPQYDYVKTILPIPVWGLILVITSIIRLLGIWLTSKALTRFAGYSALFFSIFFSVGFAVSFFAGTGSPMGALVWTLLAIMQVLGLLEPFINPANQSESKWTRS